MKARALLSVTVVATTLALAACSSSADTSATTARAPAALSAESSSAACPVTPVATTVSVDQWGDIVSALGGDCAQVTTVLQNSSVDPHDYEPTTGDIATFTNAQLVVVNGADYDPWAEKAIATLPNQPTLVSAAQVNNIAEGANPHLWYGPDYVQATADVVTAAFKTLAPGAASYFDQRKAAWQKSMTPYFDEIAAIKAGAAGKSYGATEGIFDYMADALGLVNVTPQGYQNAAAAESDPAPGDVFAFNQALSDKKMDVLIYNTQTEGSVPEQIRASAQTAGVPVVNVTETVAPGFDSFEAWQVSQLKDLATALAVS